MQFIWHEIAIIVRNLKLDSKYLLKTQIKKLQAALCSIHLQVFHSLVDKNMFLTVLHHTLRQGNWSANAFNYLITLCFPHIIDTAGTNVTRYA